MPRFAAVARKRPFSEYCDGFTVVSSDSAVMSANTSITRNAGGDIVDATTGKHTIISTGGIFHDNQSMTVPATLKSKMPGNLGPAVVLDAYDATGYVVVNANGLGCVSYFGNDDTGTKTGRVLQTSNRAGTDAFTIDAGTNNAAGGVTLKAGTGGVNVVGKLLTAAAVNGSAGVNIPAGVDPAAPVDGDLWFDGTDLKFRVAGVTKVVTLV